MLSNKVPCPCCKGKRWLVVHFNLDDNGASACAEPCTHCMGEGEVEILEVELLDDDRLVPRYE